MHNDYCKFRAQDSIHTYQGYESSDTFTSINKYNNYYKKIRNYKIYYKIIFYFQYKKIN